ncbi:protein CHUP1, chloroplastic [Iris pallida]|uniref:Protein CHUP1, chloroplastic n=1 Tax=Iris pallida TaxID=29817 RepID=A0AAX6FT41_IRIPA|nr:protein CHUP1, chloroplastic [Iris pallida]
MTAEDDANLQRKLDASLERNRCLEKENEQLKQEVLHLKGQITLLRAQDSDKRSIQWKKLQSCISSNSACQDKQIANGNTGRRGLPAEGLSQRAEFPSTSPALSNGRLPRVPKPPPRPSSCLSSTLKTSGNEVRLPPPPPPPPPLLQRRTGVSANAVRRVPEVVELYRYLTRGDDKPETRVGFSGMPVVTSARDMIGEIENRSSYLSAIKSDVESKAEFIDFLRKEVENADYKEISDVEAFVKWLDEELSHLVDERAVLKHFPRWPEQKTDAMREAACSYRDLKILESEVSSFRDDMHQSAPVALRRIQALQEKLEHRIHNLQRVRDAASKKYKEFQIPWEWMLDPGIIYQLKLGSMKLAKLHMARVMSVLQSEGSSEDENLMLQSVRFAFRVHQFVGGFDEESKHAFQELRKLANKFYP